MLSNVDDATLNNFDQVEHLISFIRRTWNVEGLAPKGFAERKAKFDGINVHAVKEQVSSFNGINDDSASCFRFPVTCSLEHVTYSDVDQGRDPLETLISACVGYGMRIEAERSRRKFEAGIEKALACIDADATKAAEQGDEVDKKCTKYGKLMVAFVRSMVRL